MNTLQFIHQPDQVARKASDVLAADWRYQSREFPSRVIIGNCRLL